VTNLTFNSLSVGYDSPLQKPFSLSVNKGEFLVLIGPNGAGKSTLLKTLIKEIEPIEGAIFLDGKNLTDFSLKDFSREASALLTVSVKPELMTARELVSQGRYPHTGHFGRLTTEDENAVSEAIRLVKAEGFSEKQFLHLSDGQKQRILFARALCQKPSLLILDEPTSYLDIKWRLELLKIIKKLSKSGVTIIASLHEIDIALKSADRILCVGNDEISLLSRDFDECKKQIQRLYDLEEDFFEENSEYSRILAARTKRNVCGGVAAEGLVDFFANNKEYKSTPLMIQGTMSNAGKSFLVAGLCRIFKQDGFSVSPFKSQNMALNSFVTSEGLEMGRAQVMQAEAAGIEPSVLMNPILLKPNSDAGSQVIVNGEVLGDMSAKEYFSFKKSLVPKIKSAYEKLAEKNDIIVIEGAGSPAEINLKENDIVNMGMAEIADSPVILVADIDRGGVFAQLYGTIELLEPEERSRIKGFIINKFRGDESILESGIRMIEEKTGIPCVGTIPYIKIQLDDEDSLSENLHTLTKFQENSGKIQLAVVSLPHISNFTDFIPLQNHPEINLYYAKEPEDLGFPDGIIIPGTKNTPDDLKWLKNSGFAGRIQEEERKGTVIAGICGGFQMLGKRIFERASSAAVQQDGEIEGLCLLPVETVFSEKKTLTRVTGKAEFEEAHFIPVSGYEIHQGQTSFIDGAEKNYFSEITDSVTGDTKKEGAVKGNVFGTYIHGLFDGREAREEFVRLLRGKNASPILRYEESQSSAAGFKESQYDLLAQTIRRHLDMKKIYEILGRKI